MTKGTHSSTDVRSDQPSAARLCLSVRPCKQTGFSMLEVLVVLAIVGIVTGFSFYGLQSWTRHSQVQDTFDGLKSAANFARAEAIKFGGNVKICGSTDSLGCSANFVSGWMVYYDLDNNDVFSATDPLLLWNEQPNQQVAVTVADIAGTPVQQFGFNYRGYPDNVLAVTATQGGSSEQFNLQRTGRIEKL